MKVEGEIYCRVAGKDAGIEPDERYKERADRLRKPVSPVGSEEKTG